MLKSFITIKWHSLKFEIVININVFVVKFIIKHYLIKKSFKIGFQSLSFSFVLGAVSPAVVVPSMLLLQESGYGIEKGIPTLLIAASSLDDIVAITGFNTCMSIVFSEGKQENTTTTTISFMSFFVSSLNRFLALLLHVLINTFQFNISLFFI